MQTILSRGMALVSHDQILALYLSHRHELLNYASGIVGDRGQAEDVVQEAWLRFASASDRGPAGAISQPVAYLFRIVRNLALDMSRQRRSDVVCPSAGVTLEDLPADRAGPEQEAMDRDQLLVVAAALAQLPERTRRAFDLHRFGDKTFAEIGKILGISQGRAHALVQDALAHWTKALMEADAP